MESHELDRLNQAFARAICADVTAEAVALTLAAISPGAKAAIIEHLDLVLVQDAFRSNPETSHHPLVRSVVERIEERLRLLRSV